MAENGTLVTEFVLLGFQLSAELQTGLFFVFLLLYLITLGGNLGVTALIQSDPRFQTPMYFFLGHLSFLDICYSSVIVPQLLETLRTGVHVPRCQPPESFPPLYTCFQPAPSLYRQPAQASTAASVQNYSLERRPTPQCSSQHYLQ